MHPQQLFRTFSEGFSEGFLQDEYRKNRNQSGIVKATTATLPSDGCLTLFN